MQNTRDLDRRLTELERLRREIKNRIGLYGPQADTALRAGNEKEALTTLVRMLEDIHQLL